ncbi:F-box/LRR-repeat protein 8-like [Amphiura filiformis]|uniref:F-box/LRR-repeat protein 8-like n=1 Tax=Amphiura filiformis TaxID=82378 RepID=UPI003B213CBC
MAVEHDWTALPDHILINIFSHLPLHDRCTAALACTTWSGCFDSPYLWRKFIFQFFKEEDARQLMCLTKHGSQLRDVNIVLNQKSQQNRENACTVLSSLARLEERRLQSISIQFTTENPLFFQGMEFLYGLAELFGPPDPQIQMLNTLYEVDLSGLSITLDDILFNLLAIHHNETLHSVNLQNSPLCCRVTPECILNLVQKCRKLTSLSMHYKSMSEGVLEEFAKKDRKPLKMLSLACRREEKYHKPISAASWEKLVDKLPNFQVKFFFDHTIERHRIATILHPHIPVIKLCMRTLTELHEEVAMTAEYYHETLEHFVITTKGTDRLQQALLNLVEISPRLKVLHCYCALDDNTISRVKELCPNLEKFTLKTTDEFNAMMPSLIGREARSVAQNQQIVY